MSPGARAIAAAGWAILLAAAMLDGTLREAALIPLVGHAVGHALSVVILVAVVAVVARALVRRPHARVSDAGQWTVGASWLVATVAFESLSGRFAFGASSSEVLGAYDLLSGDLWALVPLATLVAPAAARRASREGARRRAATRRLGAV